MDKFNLYAKYYDLLYSDKDYQGEVDYINSLIKLNSNQNNYAILDLGCGTGIHANLFTKLDCQVDGVDMSPQMISRAKERYSGNVDLNFYVNSITDFKNDKHYDVVTSLFHVMSYQNTNSDVIKTFKTAFNHLKKDGLFVFDFWYGPGVLTDRPEPRIKILEDDFIKVKRQAKPKLHINENIVDVNYEIFINNKENNTFETINEVHSMRYFFKKEIEFYLEYVGFNVEHFYEWMTFKEPNTESWNVVVVAKKI